MKAWGTCDIKGTCDESVMYLWWKCDLPEMKTWDDVIVTSYLQWKREVSVLKMWGTRDENVRYLWWQREGNCDESVRYLWWKCELPVMKMWGSVMKMWGTCDQSVSYLWWKCEVRYLWWNREVPVVKMWVTIPGMKMWDTCDESVRNPRSVSASCLGHDLPLSFHPVPAIENNNLVKIPECWVRGDRSWTNRLYRHQSKMSSSKKIDL